MKARLFITIIALGLVMIAPFVLAATESFPFSGVVNVKELNIRAGQSISFEKVGILNKGDLVVVVEKSYGWYKIKLPQQAQCYVNRKLVQFLRDQVGEITGDRVNVRSRPDLNSMIVGQLNKMTRVKILETLDEWYRIQPIEGLYGWVSEEYVDFVSQEIPEAVTVKLPARNIYVEQRKEEVVKKQQEEQRREDEEQKKVTVRGVVELIPAATDDLNVRHQITIDEGKTFYLMGYRSMLDGFLNHRVQVEGIPQDDAIKAHPVLLVTKVVLVL